jgi:tRNA dimethylallyltransferase
LRKYIVTNPLISADKKVLVLIGPTGVGKTGVSLLLAKELDTEIISADSMQIYRHMDIGTAKPSGQERSRARHHMIDIVDPWESFSTGKYIERIIPIIDTLHKEGKIPLVVGGTGLYIKAMTRGIFSGPSADWILREKLLSMEKESTGSLHDYLKKLDPEAAERITPNDTRRIVRAIEVCLKSNSSISEMQQRFTQPLPYDFIKIGLSRDRKELYRMIEERVDGMIQDGLIDEVKMIIDMIKKRFIDRELSSLNPLPSLQAIGYKEIAMHLRDEICFEEAVRLLKRGSKRYAKRQFTWFRKEEDIHWVDLTGISESDEAFIRVYQLLKGLLNKGQQNGTSCNIERNTLC